MTHQFLKLMQGNMLGRVRAVALTKIVQSDDPNKSSGQLFRLVPANAVRVPFLVALAYLERRLRALSRRE